MADKNSLAVGLQIISTFPFKYLDCKSSRGRDFLLSISFGHGESSVPKAWKNYSPHTIPGFSKRVWPEERSPKSVLGKNDGFVIHLPTLLCCLFMHIGINTLKQPLSTPTSKEWRSTRIQNTAKAQLFPHRRCLQYMNLWKCLFPYSLKKGIWATPDSCNIQNTERHFPPTQSLKLAISFTQAPCQIKNILINFILKHTPFFCFLRQKSTH